MPTLLIPPPLEVVLQGLHDSEIRCGIYGTIVGGQQVWPAAGIAAWMHETALRLYPDSPYAQAHGG
jgi:hypothetical protein